MSPTKTPPPAFKWALRALPVVAFVTIGLLTRSTPAALLALVLGWVTAVLLAATWAIRTKALIPDPVPPPSTVSGPVDDTSTTPQVAGAASTPPAPLNQHGAVHPPTPAAPPRTSDDLVDLERAERAARTGPGFLSGHYALVGDTLLPLLGSPRPTGDYTAPAHPDTPGAELSFGRWTRTIARADVTATYSYEARGHHVGGALLELEGTRDDGHVYARWNRVQDGTPNPLESIPSGFTWEKNDDYHRGWLDPGDLTDIWDFRSDR